MATVNIGKLQRQNSKAIYSFIETLDMNTAVARGEDLDSDSPIEDILTEWAKQIVVQIEESWDKKGFNPASTTQKAEPHIIDKAGVLKVLQIDMPDAWRWAENGRKAGKRPPIAPIERWITYRGIDVKKVRQWDIRKKDANGKTYLYKPYAKISDTLKLRNILASVIARSIGQKGTIKRFGYKGSKFLSSVVTPQALQDLSTQLSEAVGYTIAVSIAKNI